MSPPQAGQSPFTGPLAGTLQIGSVLYHQLPAFCARTETAWQWDPYTLTATVEAGGSDMHLVVNSRDIMVNGRWREISAPVELRHGTVWVPGDVIGRIESLNKTSRLDGSRKASGLGLYHIRTIVLDPGHGGKDPGAIGHTGAQEKFIVLDIARRLQQLLLAEGLEVVMTRSDDTFIELADRSSLANRAGADLFVSIHANSAQSRHAYGLEVYYLSESVQGKSRSGTRTSSGRAARASASRPVSSAENRVEAIELSEELISAAQRMGVRSRGIKSSRFHVLRHTEMPAVLVEIGFVTNTREEALLKKSTYRQQVARLLAEGILSYAIKFERSGGFSR